MGHFPDDRIFDKEVGVRKRAHLERIREKFGCAFEQLRFVDDKLNHLEDVASLGVECVLASWGYNGPREEAGARAAGFEVATLADAEALLFSPRFRAAARPLIQTPVRPQAEGREGNEGTPWTPDFACTPNAHPTPRASSGCSGRRLQARQAARPFREAPASEVSPLGARLFQVEGIESIFLGSDFVTVTKDTGRDWSELAAAIVDAIKDWAASGAPALGAAFEPPARGDESEVVSRIRKILDRDIQPYVAQDGGEIVFADFRDGIVEVYLQGACAGCPSSTATLKMGIEARLKEEIPEVLEVVAL